MPRIRSVDTNPTTWPLHVLGRPLPPRERFAKSAIVVTELYSARLDAGPPLEARTNWVRFIPADTTGPVVFDGEPADSSLGLGEVHEVPYDAAVLDLPDNQRRLAILDWLQANLLRLAQARGWSAAPLLAAYEACRADECRLLLRGADKSGPGRRRKAHAEFEFEIDGDGDGWSWAVVTAPDGTVEATSPRRDSLPTVKAGAKVLKSLKWAGEEVTWTPWLDDVAPRGHENWIGLVERFRP